MNWIELKGKYPSAWSKLIEWKPILTINGSDQSEDFNTLGWPFSDGVHKVLMWRVYELRNLYDFFDSQKIFINIWMSTFGKGYMTFAWYIYKPNKGMIASHKEYYTERANAEKDAFESAFRILEKQLP